MDAPSLRWMFDSVPWPFTKVPLISSFTRLIIKGTNVLQKKAGPNANRGCSILYDLHFFASYSDIIGGFEKLSIRIHPTAYMLEQ